MNPFDGPPTTPPVSFEPPSDPPTPRRGRMALVALASAGLVGLGIVGVSAFAGADDPSLETAPAGAASLAGVDDPVVSTVPAEPAPADQPDGSDRPDGTADGGPVIDGELRIDTGDGDPVVIDLGTLDPGALAACLDPQSGAGIPDLDSLFREFESMLEELDLPHDAVPPADGADPHGPVLGGGPVGPGEVTVLGPDGMTVIDLGDGDGSVTVSRDGATGELTITTDGTASQQTLDELFAHVFADIPWVDTQPDLPAPPGDLGFPPFLGDLADCLAGAG